VRILVVTTGGVTRFFRNWPEVLLAKALVRRGHHVTALTYLDARSEALKHRKEDIEGVQVERIAPRGWYSWDLSHALSNLPRPDVLHVFHLRNYLAFQAAWKLKHEGVPAIITPIGPLHDPYLAVDRDHPLDAPPRWNNLILSRRTLLNRIARDGRIKRHLENYLMHWTVSHADAVIACSEHERRLWAQLNIEAETIPLWVDAPFIRAHAGERYSVEFSHPVILFVAQLKYRKGFDLLARAMPLVTAQYPQATFVFVSHSPIHRSTLERMTRENGTWTNLRVIERATEEEKVQLYNSADVLVFPTRYEGFGLPLLEAMASGCPVVTTAIPVVDEIVCDGENGLMAPREDPQALSAAIVRVLQDRTLREKLVANGFKTLARFDEETLTARTEALYQRVARSKSNKLSWGKNGFA
jgi:glycogen synthase